MDATFFVLIEQCFTNVIPNFIFTIDQRGSKGDYKAWGYKIFNKYICDTTKEDHENVEDIILNLIKYMKLEFLLDGLKNNKEFMKFKPYITTCEFAIKLKIQNDEMYLSNLDSLSIIFQKKGDWLAFILKNDLINKNHFQIFILQYLWKWLSIDINVISKYYQFTETDMAILFNGKRDKYIEELMNNRINVDEKSLLAIIDNMLGINNFDAYHLKEFYGTGIYNLTSDIAKRKNIEKNIYFKLLINSGYVLSQNDFYKILSYGLYIENYEKYGLVLDETVIKICCSLCIFPYENMNITLDGFKLIIANYKSEKVLFDFLKFLVKKYNIVLNNGCFVYLFYRYFKSKDFKKTDGTKIYEYFSKEHNIVPPEYCFSIMFHDNDLKICSSLISHHFPNLPKEVNKNDFHEDRKYKTKQPEEYVKLLHSVKKKPAYHRF